MEVSKQEKTREIVLSTVVMVEKKCPIYLKRNFPFRECQKCPYKGDKYSCAWRSVSYAHGEIDVDYEKQDEEEAAMLPIDKHHGLFDDVIATSFRFPCAECAGTVRIGKERHAILKRGDQGYCEKCGTPHTFLERVRSKKVVHVFAIPAKKSAKGK